MREEITRASYSNHNCKYTVVIEWETENSNWGENNPALDKLKATKLKCEFCPSVEELI